MKPGVAAPDFTLRDHAGKPVRLADLKGERVILYFYPKAFTPGCTTEACDFRDRHQALAAAGYRIFGVSPDPPERLARFRDEHRLPFPLLSDPDHAVAAAYGAWGVKKNYGKEYEGLIRSTFVIGPEGSIEKAWHNVRAKGHAQRVVEDL
ncbi:MAG TPA: thioredoxin-dependent thiol peroxidase [Gemmatimonadales bacterium]|nr:thioredoxin-dependent thiol peroxidase [Gemmatimonadales bacterium]